MRFHSLRTRMLAATIVVVAATAAAFALFSSITAKRQFDRVMRIERRDPGADAAAARTIERVFAETHSWDRALATADRRVLAIDADGRVVARWPRTLPPYAVAMTPEGIRITTRAGGQLETLVLHGRWKVAGASLFFLPPAEQPRDLFAGSLDRLLLGGILVALALFIVVTATIARRIFAPVEAVTAGARALASGRLDTRVPAAGDDEIAELGRAFNAMAAALERNEETRRNLISDVAHELRTPLTNIRCQLEAVEDGLAAPDAALIASLAEETSTLARLVDDLQQLSLAEAGQLRLERAPVAAGELVARAIDGFTRTKVNILTDVDDVMVNADALRIVQVLRNLLVNAIRHAHATVLVRVRVAVEVAEFAVEDDGDGIPPEHLGRIFDRFHRADPSRSRTTGGAGLGLAIARELVQLHGGTIRAENRVEGGARVTFSVPIASRQ